MANPQPFETTNLGKELATILPPNTQRVLIDIPYEGLIKVIFVTVGTAPLPDLDWQTILKQAVVLSAADEAVDFAVKAPEFREVK